MTKEVKAVMKALDVEIANNLRHPHFMNRTKDFQDGFAAGFRVAALWKMLQHGEVKPVNGTPWRGRGLGAQ